METSFKVFLSNLVQSWEDKAKFLLFIFFSNFKLVMGYAGNIWGSMGFQAYINMSWLIIAKNTNLYIKSRHKVQVKADVTLC